MADLLDEHVQPPSRLPYVSRKLYDQRRPTQAPDAPLSARLQEKFGSWPRVCHAAWGLLEDGRSFGLGQRWARVPPSPKRYDTKEAAASVRACAEAVGRITSSFEYHMWVIARRARARSAGETIRIATIGSVYRRLAPDRANGNGWRLVVARVFCAGSGPIESRKGDEE